MALVKLADLRGEHPSVNERSLDARNAVYARNAVPEFGELRPLRGLTTVGTPLTITNPTTVFKYDANTWLEWDADIDVVRSAVANDAWDRVYFTGDGAPKVTDNAVVTTGGTPYPGTSYKMGVPAPETAPGLTVNGTGTGNPASRFYVTTFVNKYGAEGPPSPVSAEVTVETSQTVTVTLPTSVEAATYGLTLVRVYRVNTSGTDAAFQYVGEAAIGTATLLDNKLDAQLGEVLPSEGWIEPPDTMVGLTMLPNGVMAGFRENEVLLSEPGMPHAWPIEYRISVDTPVQALAVIGNALLIMASGQSYVASGSHPSAMAAAKLRTAYACLSKDGVVDMGDYAIYPSNEGLVAADTTGAILITEQLFDRDAWQALNPSTMRAFRWNYRVLVAYQDGANWKAFAMDPRNPDMGILFFDTFNFSTGYFDRADERLYIASGTTIYVWDDGTVATMVWRSKPFTLERPETMGVVQVWADTYPVSIKVINDGVHQDTVSVTSEVPQRVGSMKLGRNYQVEISTTYTVHEVQLATNMRALTET